MSRSHLSLRHRHGTVTTRPLVAFLLVASLGILFAGCASSPRKTAPLTEEFTFTEQDLARFRELAQQVQDDVPQGTGSFVPRLEDAEEGGVPSGPPVLDLSNVPAYRALREGGADAGENTYRVTNQFLNVRAAPRVTAEAAGRLTQGDTVTLLDFVDAAWARIRLPDGAEGYVSTRYIAKLVSEERLQEERRAFEGMYFVNFGFLNVRRSPDTQSELMGTLSGQAIVRPLSVDQVWARIPFEGGEGYVAVQYLAPFTPNFLIRQDRYDLPILHYRLDDGISPAILGSHVDALRAAGYRLSTFRSLRDLVLAQEQRDVRLEPRTVVLAVSGVTPENARELSDVLLTRSAPATLFIATRHVGIDGITERQILTMIANGFDVQSGTHAGDDLRSMTNAQVELELRQSRQILAGAGARDVFAVAYPWGGVNDRVMQISAESGYLFGMGAASDRSFSRGRFLHLPSLLVTAGMTSEEVLSLVRGDG